MTQRRSSFATDRKIAVGFWGGLVLFLGAAVTALYAVQRVAHDRRLVTHTYDVRAGLHALDTQLREAKSGVRSYLLTGDGGYLTRARVASDSVLAAYAAVRALTADNATQQQRLDSLRPLLVTRLAMFDSTIALGPVHGALAATLRARLAAGEAQSQRLQEALGTLERGEAALLAGRVASERRGEALLRAGGLFATLVGIGLAALMFRSVRGDLRERARMEGALRASEAKFSGILAIAADAVVTVDASQTIIHFNRGAEQIFGWTEAEVLGRPLELLIPSRFVATHAAQVAAFAAGPRTARRMGERGDVYGRRRDGEEFPAEASISKLETPDGMIFTAVLRDVTEQRRQVRHEHLLADAGRRLAATLDRDAILRIAVALPVPELGDWCLLDVVESADGTASYRRVASPHHDPTIDAALRALEAHGLDEDSPSRALDVLRTGRAEIVAAVTEDWLEAHAELAELPALRTLAPRALLFLPLVSGSGASGVLTIGVSKARRIFDAADRATGEALADRIALAIENARLYRLAQRATAAREEVLSVVSHDLRNPLSAVSMYARALLDHPPAEEGERRKLYQSVHDAAQWMHRLMQDLLDAASIDAGRLSVDSEPQAPARLVEGAVAMFAGRATAQRVKLVADVAPGLPDVQADAGRVLQLFGNLLGNALKYTPDGGTVTVGAAPGDGAVVFVVRDTGAGIAPADLPNVFERFWHRRGASRTRGTGLGLAIARGIVAAHGGRIWAESTLGAGSTFYFTLPVASATRGDRKDRAASVAGGR